MIKEKKRRWLFITLVLTLIVPQILTGWTSLAQAKEKVVKPKIEAKSYILMDAGSGSVLMASADDKPLPPASMTKMMTEYLVLESIKKGALDWDQKVTVSTNASLIGGSQVWLREHEERTVKELFTAMSVYSANDATVALAEEVAGDETAFVGMMNDKAKEMGLMDSHFRNSTGLPQDMYPTPPDVEGKHLMSARDSATLGRFLITDYPEITEFTTIAKQTFREGEKGAINMINWNRMIKGLEQAYEGVDGLKTGNTDDAGFCFTGTAKRGDMRLITVVMGATSQSKRFKETKKLLDYGFNHYETKTFVKAKSTVPQYETAAVAKGKEIEVEALTTERVGLAVKKDDLIKYELLVTFKEGLQAPIKSGDVVGEVTVLYDGKTIQNFHPVALVAESDVAKAGWFRLFFRGVKDAIVGIFSGLGERVSKLFS